MRSKFDEQLALLNTELIKMGTLCEEAIAAAAKALTDADLEPAEKLFPMVEEIDSKEKDIENLCLRLLLQQQPVAGDLRQISAALKMITDMERIGDQSADIGEIIVYLKGRRVDEFRLIGEMAIATQKMVVDSIEAFVKQDVELAGRVIEDDDRVDGIFDEIKSSLITMINQKLEDGEYAIDLLMIAKYFERIGDHAVNVARWVVFSVTGIHVGKHDADSLG